MDNPPTFSDSDSPLRSLLSQRSVPKSPYLNFDPDYVAKPEFILPEGASKQRGRFELAFGQIGASVMLGALLGGSAGFYNGLRNTTLAGQTGKLRRTQLLNHITKQGAASANTLGSIALMYSSFGVIYSYIRGNDDEINTLAAATSTGLLFKSTSGLRKCAVGGGLGFGIATAYILITSRDRIQAMFSSYSPA